MAEGAQKLRLFVGVRISVASAELIAEAARQMREAAQNEGLSLRWVPSTNYHITLKFLGWTQAPVVSGIRDEVASALAGAGAFEVECAGTGAFPKPEKARVLWAGVRDPEAGLGDLAERVERAGERLGFPAEARSFHPHVTLARLRRPADVTDLLASPSEQEFRKSWIDSVVLFESEMKSSGSEYVERALWPLESPGSACRRQT